MVTGDRRASSASIRPSIPGPQGEAVKPGQLEDAPYRRRQHGVDSQVPSILAGIAERAEQQMYAAAVNEAQFGEIEPNRSLLGAQLRQAVSEGRRRTEVKLARQPQPQPPAVGSLVNPQARRSGPARPVAGRERRPLSRRRHRVEAARLVLSFVHDRHLVSCPTEPLYM